MARVRQQSYSVHEGPDPAVDRIDRAERLAFVKDGFIKSAAIFPPFWLAARGIWLGVAVYAGAAIAIFGIAWVLLLPSIVTLLAFLALHLFFAGEADEMLRAHLTFRGWTTIGQVTGASQLDCERRFFDNWLPTMPLRKTLAPIKSSAGDTTPSPGEPGSVRPNQAVQIAESRAGVGAIIGNLLSPRPRDSTR